MSRVLRLWTVALLVNLVQGSVFPKASDSCEKKCITSFDGAQSDACNKGCVFLIAAKNVKNPPPCAASCATRYAAYPKLIAACTTGCGAPSSVAFEPKAHVSPLETFWNIAHQCMKSMGWNSNAPSRDNVEDSENVGTIRRIRIFVNPFNFGGNVEKTDLAKEMEDPAKVGVMHRFRIFFNPFNSGENDKKTVMMNDAGEPRIMRMFRRLFPNHFSFGQNEEKSNVESYHLSANRGSHHMFQSGIFKHNTTWYILVGSGISCVIIFCALVALLVSGSRRRMAAMSAFHHRRLEEDYSSSTDVKLPIPDDDMRNSKFGTKNEGMKI